MATTVITDLGTQAILAAIVSGTTVSVNAYKVADEYNFTPLKSDTTVKGNIVWTSESTTYSGETAPALQITRVGDNAIQITMRIPNDCGTFVIGNYGFFTSSGELFALTALENPITKYYDETSQSGREVVQSIEIAFNMAGDTVEMTVNHEYYNDIPVYSTIDALPDFYAGGNNLALIQEYYRVDSVRPVPTFFYKDYNQNEWVPLITNGDTVLDEVTRDLNLNIRSSL